MHRLTENMLACVDLLAQDRNLDDKELAAELQQVHAALVEHLSMVDPRNGCDHTVVTTYSGVQFDLASPNKSMVRTEDIAHHLSQIPHWNGAAKHHISVAQHTVLVTALVPPEQTDLRRWALIHDAPEFITGDDTRPKKNLIPELRFLEDSVLRAVVDRYKPYVDGREPRELKYYDNLALAMERLALVHPNAYVEGEPYYVEAGRLLTIHGSLLEHWSNQYAEDRFLRVFKRYFPNA